MDLKKGRFEFLDILRFIAASSVLLQHTLEKVSPSFRHFTTYYFQFGIFGVTLFFLSSGFIIPVSLERSSSLKKFWTGRIFRLYPLYLISIAVTLISIHYKIYNVEFPNFKTIIANVLMFEKFLGQPGILVLYWTLGLEMLFYISLSVVFFMGYIKKSTALAIGFLGLSFLVGAIGSGFLHVVGSGWGTLFYFASMFVGTIYYRLMHNEIKFRTFVLILLFAAFVLLSNAYLILYNHDKPEFGGDKSFFPVVFAMLGAYVVFTLVFALRKLNFPVFLVYFGTISYSLYLVQGTVITVIPFIRNGFISTAVWISSTFIISIFTYKYIEKPFMRIGRNLSNQYTDTPLPTNK